MDLHDLTEAAAAADYDATGDSLAGWGGTGPYCPQSIDTDLGMAKLYAQAQRRLHAAWSLCHDLGAPAQEDESDLTGWAVEREDGEIARYRTRRGARWSATHAGGRVIRVADSIRREQRIRRGWDRLRAAVRFAIAVGELYAAVTVALGGEYPDQTICVEHDGVLPIQGPGWWAGSREDSGSHPIERLRQFSAGGAI